MKYLLFLIMITTMSISVFGGSKEDLIGYYVIDIKASKKAIDDMKMKQPEQYLIELEMTVIQFTDKERIKYSGEKTIKSAFTFLNEYEKSLTFEYDGNTFIASFDSPRLKLKSNSSEWILIKITENEGLLKIKELRNAQTPTISKYSALQKKESDEAKRTIIKENIPDMGIWEIRNFVDQFGEKTSERYITNKDKFVGIFSNSATENSELNVSFLISSPSNISIMLYEYAGKNPVKPFKTERYKIESRDSNGGDDSYTAENTSDRLSLDHDNSMKLHRLLLKGGKIKFSISVLDKSHTTYSFSINNADSYDNAFEK